MRLDGFFIYSLLLVLCPHCILPTTSQDTKSAEHRGGPITASFSPSSPKPPPTSRSSPKQGKTGRKVSWGDQHGKQSTADGSSGIVSTQNGNGLTKDLADLGQNKIDVTETRLDSLAQKRAQYSMTNPSKLSVISADPASPNPDEIETLTGSVEAGLEDDSASTVEAMENGASSPNTIQKKLQGLYATTTDLPPHTPNTLKRKFARSYTFVKMVKEKRAAKTLGMIVGCFVLCWLPFFIVNVLTVLCHNCVAGDQELLFVVVTWLGHCNSFLNPLIYSCFNRDFQKAFRQIFSRRPSGFLPYTAKGGISNAIEGSLSVLVVQFGRTASQRASPRVRSDPTQPKQREGLTAVASSASLGASPAGRAPLEDASTSVAHSPRKFWEKRLTLTRASTEGSPSKHEKVNAVSFNDISDTRRNSGKPSVTFFGLENIKNTRVRHNSERQATPSLDREDSKLVPDSPSPNLSPGATLRKHPRVVASFSDAHTFPKLPQTLCNQSCEVTTESSKIIDLETDRQVITVLEDKRKTESDTSTPWSSGGDFKKRSSLSLNSSGAYQRRLRMHTPAYCTTLGSANESLIANSLNEILVSQRCVTKAVREQQIRKWKALCDSDNESPIMV